MQSLSLSSRVEHAQQLLSNLQEQILTLPSEYQAGLCGDIEHIAETLTAYGFSGNDSGDPDAHAPTRQTPEYRMGLVLRKAHAGVFVRDLVNKTVTWSPELYELLGLDPAEPSRSEKFMSMIHPEDAGRMVQATQAAIQQGGSYYMEFRVIRPDGEVIWLSSIGYVEHDEAGHPLTLTGINQDISTRKQAEQAQEQAHAEAIQEKKRLEAVMEAMPSGVAILNAKGEVIQANRGYEAIWGGPRPATASVDDFSIYKAWWAESQQPVAAHEWAAARALLHGETVANQFLEIERFDGARRYVLNSAAPIRDDEDPGSGSGASPTYGSGASPTYGSGASPTYGSGASPNRGCVVVIRDITERIQAEQALHESERALHESEERLRVVLSALPITVFMLDRDLRFTWVYNPQHGLTAERMVGKRDDEIYPNVSPAYMAQLKTILASGQGYQSEVQTSIFGDECYFLLSIERVEDIDGRPAGLIGASMDITEQRRLEQETRAARQQVEQQRKIIEHREKERQEIAREIHDGPIQTLVSMMFEIQVSRGIYEQAGVTEEVQLELDKINARLKSAVRELRDVVNNLRPPALLRFGLGKTLRAYVEDFRDKHPELALDVLFDLPDDQIYFSEETSLSIYRLCQEGLNNIIRHAQATQATIRFTRKGKALILEIKDNGKGFKVPKDLSQKMQEGHYGLAGMHERVGALGGALRIRSSSRSGTTVRVAIPLKQQAV